MDDQAFADTLFASPDLAGFLEAIRGVLPKERVVTDPLRLLAYGADASLYKLTPQAVLTLDSEAEMAEVLRLAARHRTPVTFRAGGTSLSGQALTDWVLLRIGTGFRGLKVLDGGARIALQPAVIGSFANKVLAPMGRKIGPDPASIDSAHIGGIAANNASGMCCGVGKNSYRTLDSMRLILADGALVDTGDPDSRAAFARSHESLLKQLAALGAETRADETLAARIRRKFSIKNTCGYSLNALVDYEDPIEILQHLMIGSEGTLGFIAGITYRTVEEHAHKATALVPFPDLRAACRAVIALRPQPVDAVELLDRASLRAVQDRPGTPEWVKDAPEGAAALLVEVRAADADTLHDYAAKATEAMAAGDPLSPVVFSEDAAVCAKLWAVRKGTFTAVGAARPKGTAVIIEDVAVEVEKLADAALDLRELFARHGFDDAIIFGHALEGNLHFVLTPDFGQPGAIERYSAFMDELAALIVGKHDGALKAEHGTGRNMAPYVEMEWGAQAYDLMKRLKALLDPDGILNPGVVLNDDATVHLKNIKLLPPADPIVDRCIECGFCEPTCPSKGLTLTPRQRIVGLREISRLETSGEDPGRLAALRKSYAYDAVDTCAVDSLCAKACPVEVDTGRMMKTLRGRRRGRFTTRISGMVARNFGAVAKGVRGALWGADLLHRIIGTRLMNGLCVGVRRLSGGAIPLWTPSMPRPAPLPKAPKAQGRDRVVYFPSCATRTMGPARGEAETRGVPAALMSLLDKAGYDVVLPEALDSLCCGQPFESKGFFADADAKRDETLARLRAASRDGADPILFDTSPCAFRALKANPQGLKVYELADFLAEKVLPRVTLAPQGGTVAVHPSCSNLKLGNEGRIDALVRACGVTPERPPHIRCCGWSGDRGFTYPELNASALKGLRDSLPAEVKEGVSTSRTCEIGLAHHSGRPYRSIAYLMDKAAQPKA